MTTREIIRAALLAMSPLTCGCTGDPVVHDVFGGKDAYDTVASATEFKAFLIDSSNQELRWGTATIDDYPVTAGPVVVAEDLGSQLVASITSKDTYVWDSDKAACQHQVCASNSRRMTTTWMFYSASSATFWASSRKVL
jgi:hypothetical protein